MNGFSTRAVHGSRGPVTDPYGALRPALYDSAAFEFSSSLDIEQAFIGRKPAHTYSRVTNPTVEEFERRMVTLSGGFGAVAVASGMAAIADTIVALTEPGANIITSRHLFGHTLSLFTKTLGRWGLHTRFADMTDATSLINKIDRNTRCIFLESITNPQLEVAAFEEIAAIAHAANIPLIIDGTVTTPYLFNAKKAGAAIEVLSSTKYISGGATTVGGVIIDYGTFDWSKTPALFDAHKRAGPGALLYALRKEVFRNFGSCLAPHNAWLQILGLETLPLRIHKSCENALAIAHFLELQPDVAHVNYPGLPSSPSFTAASSSFENGFGSILTFSLSDKKTCFALMDALKLIRRATNLCDNKTLIIHPASTIFHEFSAEERSRMGIGEGLLRLSLGIEESDDIIHDLAQGLEKL